MKDFFLTSYSVQGIKSLDKMVTLSFYKKTIDVPSDSKKYNVKGIYGMNGSGKSGIISSVRILKNLLTDANYLSNPMVQRNLSEIINKKTQSLVICAEFILKTEQEGYLYKYEIVLEKNSIGKYYINSEKLSYKNAKSSKGVLKTLLGIKNGEIQDILIDKKDEMQDYFIKKTTNLLSLATAASLFMEKVFASKEINQRNPSFMFFSLLMLYVFGRQIYVYMDQSDDHTDYIVTDILEQLNEDDIKTSNAGSLLKSILAMERNWLSTIVIGRNIVRKEKYGDFSNDVSKLREFIQKFKYDLKDIYIEKKEDGEVYVCDLYMVYEEYSVNVEFESTGIKKLIKLFVYIREMVNGSIVFIDEFDSNLHDVYLCALLEYLMEYGEGQLCFTTHNVGPMETLKKNSKSIDFLSEDKTIYQWKTNGNYSPSNLYKKGMIEGSPFNVDSIDFIGVFDEIGGE